MSKVVTNCVFVVFCGVIIATIVVDPNLISDKNTFLKNFVNHEILGFLGVVVTVTLASSANIHFELNKLEKQVGREVFGGTKRILRKSSNWMIGMLVIALAVCVVKPLCPLERAEAVFNGAALLIVTFCILIFVDITHIVFKIHAGSSD